MNSVRQIGLGLMFLGVVSCGGAKIDDAARVDITSQMQVAQPGIHGCYFQALQRNRRLRGQVVLAIRTEANTGRFSEVRVVDKETLVYDPQFEQCLVGVVSTLHLAKPTKDPLSFRYPILFSPAK